MNKKIKVISILLLILIIMSVFPVNILGNTANKEILVLGNDLTPQMVQELKTIYGIDYEVQELIITNKEEHEALGDYISAEIITNKSMSSAHIKLLNEGEGIKVKTHNINWVTEDMYRNALATAGIKDAEVTVAAPFQVSGTAALTGSMKAYEELTGEKIDKEEQDVANEEMVTTAELSDSVGESEAEKIITEVKIFIIENDITDPKVISEAIDNAAKNANVKLSEEDKQSIEHLMKRISKLDIDVNQMKDQLGDIIGKLDKIEIDTEEVKGILEKILDAITNFFNKIFG